METMTEKKDTTYNGWTNYETWNVALWLDNDRTEYEVTRSKARAYRIGGALHEGRTAAGEFADWLQEYVDETRPEIPASMWSDLLSAAFSEVNWYEIAENLLAEDDA